jgi:hypothetical protein
MACLGKKLNLISSTDVELYSLFLVIDPITSQKLELHIFLMEQIIGLFMNLFEEKLLVSKEIIIERMSNATSKALLDLQFDNSPQVRMAI